MKLELLRIDEWNQVEGIFQSNGGRINPDTELISVAKETNGSVIGIAALETVVHIGPIWVDKDYRGSGLMGRIIAKLESILRGGGYYMFPSNPSSIKVCEKLGMRKIGEVWAKEL